MLKPYALGALFCICWNEVHEDPSIWESNFKGGIRSRFSPSSPSPRVNMNVHLQHHCWEKAHFLFLQSRPSPKRHQGGGTGCAPYVVSGGGQLSSSHACWDASCFKTITSPSCYYTQLGRKIHPFGHYWHHLDINIKFSVIWFSICFLPSLLTEAQLQAASPHPQRSEKHIWCGYCWGWSPVVEVNEKTDVLSADCVVCFQDDLPWSV